MKSKIFALSLLVAAVGQGQTVELKMLDLPILGSDGSVAQRLKAKSGSGTFSDPIFKDGVIEFVQSPDAKISNGSKMYFQEAIFHRETNIIEGSGPIRFLSPEVQLSGDGYSYDLESGKLTLKANVVLLRSTVRVVSANGLVTIKRNEAGHKWMIQDADLLGGVQSFGMDVKGKKIDRIENDHAHYDGIKEEVILSSPIHFWSEGKKGEFSSDLIRIDLKKQPNKTIETVPTAVTSPTVREPRQQ